MKPAGVALALVLAFAIETTLVRFTRAVSAVDLLLVVVVYVALRSGPVTGLLAGAVAGLVQDYGMSSGIIGIGGLGKTLVGFFAGVVGTQFIVSQPLPRFVVFFGATVIYQAITVGLGVLLDVRAAGAPYGAIAVEGLVNATIGLALFQMTELLPGALERRRRVRR